MPDKPVLRATQRDRLFNRLKDDPKLREMMKQDWRAAMQAVGIKPETIVKGTMSRREIDDYLAQRAGWTIEIVISSRTTGAERVQVSEAVNFEARK